MASIKNDLRANTSPNGEEISNSEQINGDSMLKSNCQVLTCIGQGENVVRTNLDKGETQIGNRDENRINSLSENCDSLNKMVDTKNVVLCEASTSLNENNELCGPSLNENISKIITKETNNCDTLLVKNLTEIENGAPQSCVLNIDQESTTLLENNSNIADTTIKKSINCDEQKNVSCDKTQKSKSSNQNKSSIPEAFNHLLDYGMSDSEDSDSDSVSLSDTSDTNSDSSNEIEDQKNKNTKTGTCPEEKFRENDTSSDTSTYYDSDSSTSESADNGACAITPVANNKEKLKKKMPSAIVTRGELTLDDLPPIERLQISVPEQDCVQIGFISSIVEQLVIVQSLPGMPAYDIDTLLFLEKGAKPLGKIFDVLGPVTEPFYAVRFNSYKETEETGIKPGIPVYCAPYNADHTAFVFVSELMKMKGSDASWKHNNEPPEQYLDYSDDEQERMVRNKKRSNKQTTEIEIKKTNSLERNKKFERHMNNKNTLMNQRFNPPSTSQRFEEQKMPQNWSMPPPRPVRPEFCLPYGYFNQYGNFPMMPQFGMPPVMGQNVFQPFNPHIPPPNPHMPHMAPSNPHMTPSNHPMAPSNHHLGPNPHLATSNPHMSLTNPHMPPPLLRPQPVPYFPNPRHPRWGPPGAPGPNYGNGSQ